jgi:flagellar basal-body rod modification protein FlgD
MNIHQLSSALPAASAAPTSSTPTASSPTPTSDANDAESAFLQLLVTELQSQDPTQPMDPTEMVGQMLSMNQLNELISINQTLQSALIPGAAAASASANAASPTTQSILGAL